MVASAALGAAAVQTLHAQVKPLAYNTAEITIMDQDGYNKEYLPLRGGRRPPARERSASPWILSDDRSQSGTGFAPPSARAIS
jgi:hypothetical protein